MFWILKNFCKSCNVWTNLFHNVFVIALKESDTYVSQCRVFLYKKWSKNLTINSEPNFLRRLKKRQEWSNPNGRDKITLEKNSFISDKLGHYKTYDFKKFLILDAFKHVRLQNAFNKCKFHQILPLASDYACFLVKCINYQNVMCLKIIYFLQDAARFLQKMHFLQETQLLQNFCKKWKSVARYIFYKNFAKVVFFCELGMQQKIWMLQIHFNFHKTFHAVSENFNAHFQLFSAIKILSLWCFFHFTDFLLCFLKGFICNRCLSLGKKGHYRDL